MIVVSEITVDDKEDQPCVKIAKERLDDAVAQFRRQFGDQPTRAMGEVLSGDVVAAMLKAEVAACRQEIYPPLTTLGLFIDQALSSDGACQDAVARNRSQWRARGEAGCNQSVYPQSGVQKPELGFPLAMLVALISLSLP